ncbi:MAG TPA: helix-turn-helix domain-containing protein [Vineibacter sp.]|nr:helix-turn-helix domain-containing protein [Vineibacter sp.]
MTRKAFASIAAGLADALADAQGKPGYVTRVHEPVRPIDVKKVRRKLGLTQEAFAARFNIPMPTLLKWEQGQREPSGPTRVLLHVIDRHPKLVMRVVKTAQGRDAA